MTKNSSQGWSGADRRDAAATCDPTFTGLSLTLCSVRLLRDQLLSHEDWDVAGHASPPLPCEA